jgi:type IV pilus assembly protein PilA
MKTLAKAQKGFTLIELMIVIAIIGILASIAIPQYQIYTQRTEVTNTLSNIRTIQLAVQEYYSTTSTLPPAATDLASYGIDALHLAEVSAGSPLISSVAVGAVGVMTITFAATAPGDLSAATLIITPQEVSNVVSFTVLDGLPGGTLLAKYRPKL